MRAISGPAFTLATLALILHTFANAYADAKDPEAKTMNLQEVQMNGYVSPNEFQGSDIERINQAVAAAAKTGRQALIPKINRKASGDTATWLIDSAILPQAGSVIVLEDCRIKLSDAARDNFIRSANCGEGMHDIEKITGIHIIGIGSPVLEGADHPRSTGDSAKPLSADAVSCPWPNTYGTDAGKAGERQTGDWRNIGILLAYVDDFSIENIKIVDSHCWAISMERCAYGRLRDIRFDSHGGKHIDGQERRILNQDGIDLRQGCHDITIENISGRTGDDIIALTNIMGKQNTPTTMISGRDNRGGGQDDIRNIIIRNVAGATCHHTVRLLNAGGLKIHDVIIDGVIDTGTAGQANATVKIGDSNPAWGGRTPPGDTFGIAINNILSRAKKGIFLAGALSNSSISNILGLGSERNTMSIEVAPDQVRDVMTANVGGR